MRVSRNIFFLAASSFFVRKVVTSDGLSHFSFPSKDTELYATPPIRETLSTVLRQPSKKVLLSLFERASDEKYGVIFARRGLRSSPLSRAAVPQNLKQHQRVGESETPQKKDFFLSQLSFLLEGKEKDFRKRSRLFYHVCTKSYWYAECYLWVLWGTFIVIVVSLFLGTYRTFSWNVIEPITYLFGYTGILFALWWYQRYGQEFSCTLFRKIVAERLYQNKIRKLNGVCDSCRLFPFHRPLFCTVSRRRKISIKTMEEEVVLLARLSRDIKQLRILIDQEKKKK